MFRLGSSKLSSFPTFLNSSWRKMEIHNSIKGRNPSFHNLVGELSDKIPSFKTRGEEVRVIYEPREFYDTLLHRISNAKRRIFIASLYIGKEETELISTIHKALTDNSSLEVTILLDYLRCTRETPKPSSASLVASLSASFPNRVNLRLYHTPELIGWKKTLIPRRFDEGWGLQHIKCYGFDDDVIISGANLSNDYFTNRQDRYIEFLSHPTLSDYFQSLIKTISSYSFKLSAIDSTSPHPPIQIEWPSTNAAPSPLLPSTSIIEFKSKAHESFIQLTKTWTSKPPSSLTSTLPPSLSTSSTSSISNGKTIPHASINAAYDTTLYPVLQMGPFSISQETDLVVPAIFRTANSLATAPGGGRTMIDWTSGYFSVQKAYLEKVLDSKAGVRIVTASPEANGFFNSKGISKYVPPAYTYLQKQFYDQTVERAKKRNRESHIELREWKREGWTYHAKGIWLTPSTASLHRVPLAESPSDQSDQDTFLTSSSNPSTPFLTLLGSSNYGQRSATRDLEANLLVLTTSNELRHDLKEEVLGIRHFAEGKVDGKLFARKDRKVGWGVRTSAKIIEDML